MAGLFFLIMIVKLIIKTRLYTVFESSWSSSHQGIITIDGLVCVLWLFPIYIHCIAFCFYRSGIIPYSLYCCITDARPRAWASPGVCQRSRISGPTHDLLDHNLNFLRTKCPERVLCTSMLQELAFLVTICLTSFSERTDRSLAFLVHGCIVSHGLAVPCFCSLVC